MLVSSLAQDDAPQNISVFDPCPPPSIYAGLLVTVILFGTALALAKAFVVLKSGKPPSHPRAKLGITGVLMTVALTVVAIGVWSVPVKFP